MKDFLIYTGMRIGLFIVAYAVLFAIAKAVDAGDDAWIWILVGAGVISMVASLFLLSGPRDRLAQSVQDRAARASAKFEEMKAREDSD